jgi:glycosyltransferase involved in cell wall biosynthesis
MSTVFPARAGAAEGHPPPPPPSLGRAPRILIVTGLFTPSRLVGARRPERMARALKARGWDVTVLTLHERFMEPLDPDLAVPPGIEVIRTTMLRPGTRARSIVAWLGRASRRVSRDASAGTSGEPSPSRPGGPGGVRSRVHALTDWLNWPDAWCGWYPFARWAVRKRQPDVVLATTPPFTSTLVAASVARAAGARLVLDYRDPWSDSPERAVLPGSPRVRYLATLRRLEGAQLERSDLVLATTRRLGRALQSRTSAPVRYVPNSFEERDPTPRASEPVSRDVVYLGSLSYGRDLTPVLRAFADLNEVEGSTPARLVYAGPHGSLFRSLAETLGVRSRVVDLGDVSHGAAQEILASATASIVIVADGYETMLPAKLFEAVQASCPVLVIGAEDSEAVDIVRRHNLGWCHAKDDREGLRESLRLCLRGERPTPRDVSELSTSTVMDRLDDELRRLVVPQ